MRRGALYMHFHTSPHLTLGKRGLGTSRFLYSQRGAGANPTKIYDTVLVPATENNEIQVAWASRNMITRTNVNF